MVVIKSPFFYPTIRSSQSHVAPQGRVSGLLFAHRSVGDLTVCVEHPKFGRSKRLVRHASNGNRCISSLPTQTMDLKHLKEFDRRGIRGYWWHVAKLGAGHGAAPPPFSHPLARLIEGGVGGGANLLAFRDLGYRVSGFDILPEAIADTLQRVGD